MNRRFFLQTAVLACGYGALINTRYSLATDYQMQLGIQTYSFRDLLPLGGDVIGNMIKACQTLGINQLELFEPTIEPPAFSANAPWAVKMGKPTEASLFGRPPEGPPPESVLEVREKIAKWRLETPIDHFVELGERFKKAGISIHSFNYGLKEYCSDEEVLKGIEITQALGTNIMTASTTIKMAERVIKPMEDNNILLGIHGHSNLHDPNHFATPESFEKALAMSDNYMLNLDLGHFAAAGFDCVPFIRKHADRIVSVHLKDRKKNNGINMPFGKGDTPILEVVKLIKNNKLPIAVMIEYEYEGGSSVEAISNIIKYVKSA